MLSAENAYAECARITRTEAKNFSYGIQLLPAPKRNAMSALYAMARRIDDISDGSQDEADKLAGLAAVDDDIDRLATGALPDADDAVLVGLHHAAQHFAIPISALGEIVEGCRRDSLGATYTTLADTEAYCRLVAGSVGRLSLGVFGLRPRASIAPDDAAVLADDLGVGLQLTNILRDIVEDRSMGRTYLASADIERFGGAPNAELVRHYVSVAQAFYVRGLPLLDVLDRRSQACVAAMAGIYRRLLATIADDPTVVLRERVSLTTGQKLWVAARSLAGVSP